MLKCLYFCTEQNTNIETSEMTNYLKLSASEVLQQLRNGSISAQDLYSHCHKRMKTISSLNAFVRHSESARSDAENSANLYDKGQARCLEGLPIAIKDNFCTQGLETTCASKMLQGFIPPYSATVVSKLVSAGAVVMGKTNLDEFGMGSATIESIYGPTKNVWRSGVRYEVPSSPSTPSGSVSDDWHVAGGSSGGSAVAVASGACFAALGSDTGGSTRNPASYCGVVGFKPSYGLLSRHGLIPLVNSMDVPGIFTRSVADTQLIFDLLRGVDPLDPTTVDMPPVALPEKLEDLVIGIPTEFHCQGLAPEMVDTWTSLADKLANLGAKVIPVSLPHTKYSIACYSVLNPCEVASNMARYDGIRYGLRVKAEQNSTEAMMAASRHAGFNDIVRGRILAGNYFLLKKHYDEYFVQALKVRRLISEDYKKVFKDVHVLLTPVTLSAAPKHSEFIRKDQRAQSAEQDYCTQPANMAGVPAITLPIRLNAEGLPLSLQLMGPLGSDAALLSISRSVESVCQFPNLNVVD